MSNPWTLEGKSVCISKPEYDWERIGPAPVNERPAVFQNNGTVNIVYSASHSLTDDYCLAMLTLLGDSLLDRASWEKLSQPVLRKTVTVFGPGHCSSPFPSPDGTEDWIALHSAVKSNAGWNRQVNIHKITWNDDGTPNFGTLKDVGEPMQVPSGEEAIFLEEQANREQAEREKQVVPQSFYLLPPKLTEYVAD